MKLDFGIKELERNLREHEQNQKGVVYCSNDVKELKRNKLDEVD